MTSGVTRLCSSPRHFCEDFLSWLNEEQYGTSAVSVHLLLSTVLSIVGPLFLFCNTPISPRSPLTGRTLAGCGQAVGRLWAGWCVNQCGDFGSDGGPGRWCYVLQAFTQHRPFDIQFTPGEGKCRGKRNSTNMEVGKTGKKRGETGWWDCNGGRDETNKQKTLVLLFGLSWDLGSFKSHQDHFVVCYQFFCRERGMRVTLMAELKQKTHLHSPTQVFYKMRCYFSKCRPFL